MSSVQTDVLIVGAGPSGLSLGCHLDRDHLIVEKEDSVGGLCRSIEHEGGIFDLGGHSFHTPHPEVRAFVEGLMEGNWHTQTRDARVFSHGVMIPYPFQRFFERIPDKVLVEECRRGLSATSDTTEAADFEDYIIRRFGEGIAEHFMLPYNRKLWARDISKISCEWTAERVAAAADDKESFDGKSGQRKPLQPDTVVGYPRSGGFEEIFRTMAGQAGNIELGEEMLRLDPVERTAVTSRGRTIKWNYLVSTIPIDTLLARIDGTPERLLDAVGRLEYMSLNLLLMLVDSPLFGAPHRIYSADPAVPPHKTAFNHTSSESLRRRPVHAVMAEISYSDEKPLMARSQIEEQTRQFLERTGVLSIEDEILWSDHIDVKYGYPVYTHERPEIMAQIREYLAGHGICTIGRFGGWEYVNSDRCIMAGMKLASELKEGSA